jgi:hypothetical protein
VKFMQTWMVYFYPERMDIFAKAQAIAKELGGEVHPPHMSWKYTWIKNLFGMPLARRAQVALPRFRWSLVRFWDKTLFRLGNRGLSGI